MSLKDLLGLFDDKKTNQSNNLNVSLQQGANFNSMQDRIEASVEPRLALIEQTTEQGLGSIIENFSGNSSEAPLAKVNTAEYKQLQDLEDKFNKAVSAYTQKQKAVLGGQPSVEVNWPNKAIMNNCSDFTSTVGPYQDPKGQYLASACQAGHDGNNCNEKFAGGGTVGAWKRTACGYGEKLKTAKNPMIGTGKQELDTMFKALQAKATELQQKTMAFHGQQQQLTGADGQLTQQKSSTLQQLKELQSQQSRLNKLMTEGDTLSAIIHDNTLQMNAAYMRYFVWLGAAVTLGLVAMHRAAK